MGIATGHAACPHHQIIHKLEKDMYHGNGKPGMTTRMEVAEGDVSALKLDMKTMKRMMWSMIMLLLTILGAVVTKH